MKTSLKIITTVALLCAAAFASYAVTHLIAPPATTQLALNAVNGTSADFYAAEARWPAQNVLLACFWTIAVFSGLIIWRKELRNLRTLISAIGATMFILPFGPVGCARYDVPEYIEVQPSQTAFVIPLESSPDGQVKFESEAALQKHMVATKRIQVPHRWNKTGRMAADGDWIPMVKVILLDRSPRTVELSADDPKQPNLAVWTESSDSIGFSLGWTVTAFIREEDAARFLYWYPARALDQVLQTEVRGRIQQAAAEVTAKQPLDLLRTNKLEILNHVREDVTNFFNARGISITTIGMFGGMNYENKEIQASIDKTFVNQQEKVNAKALLDAQADKNARINSEATAMAEAFRTKAKGEADGIELVNTALAKASNNPQLIQLRQLEVEKARIEKWGGTYPQVVAGAGANAWIGLGKDIEMSSAVSTNKL